MMQLHLLLKTHSLKKKIENQNLVDSADEILHHLKLKIVNILVTGHLNTNRKTIYLGDCLKRGVGQFKEGFGEREEGGIFEGVLIPNAHYGYLANC